MDQIEAGVQGLSVGKKKRSARAYHDLGPAVADAPSGIPPMANGSFSQLGNIPNAANPNVPIPPSSTMAAGPSTVMGGNPIPAHHFAADKSSPLAQSNGYTVDADTNGSISSRRYNHQFEYFGPNQDGTIHSKPFLTFENVVPPTAGTQFQACDQGTASAKFMRSTMYIIPESEQLRKASKLPVSVTITPFASLLDTEDTIPVVDMTQTGASSGDVTDIGPVRCRRCRTYMNPAMQHQYDGKFTCNICLFPNNVVPTDYSAMIDPVTLGRVDIAQRPELHRGVYDILVPKTYNAGGEDSECNSLHHLILIDITVESIKRNLPSIVSDAIRSIMFSDKCPKKVAIVLFDTRIHFFNLSSSLQSTQIVISADLDDPFVPFFDGLFADPQESEQVIEDALNHIEQLCSDDSLRADTEPSFSAALRTAMVCLSEVGGGKVTSILSALPSWGPGALKFKDVQTQASSLSPEVQKKIYSPDSEYYKLLAKDFLKNNVGLDCFVVSTTAVDLSNIGWLCSITGGSVFRWSNFNFERDSREFLTRFVNSLTKTTAYQSQLKLRCSNGLQVTQYYGTSSSVQEVSVIGANAQDPIIPIISENQSFTVLLEYDGKLSTAQDCHFQAAILYTDRNGIRKVRVINLVLAVSERLDDIFNFMDQDAVITTIVRDTLSFVGRQVFKELRESVGEKLVDVLAQYRFRSGHNTISGNNQLLMPDSLGNFPLFILAFLKSNAIKDGKVTADARLFDIFQMLNMSIDRLMYHLYPALIELHSLSPEEGLIPQEEINPLKFIYLPKFKDLSLYKLEAGVYILCDGFRVLLWVRLEANPLLIQDLFGKSSVQEIDSLSNHLPELDTEISAKARNIVEHFNKLCGLDSNLVQIIREGIDGSDIYFKEHLIEDGSKMAIDLYNSNYPDFLSKLHKAIQVKLENEKEYKNSTSTTTASSLTADATTLAQRYINF